MKPTFYPLLMAGMLTLAAASCKEKPKSSDIIVAKYVPQELKAPIKMPTDERTSVADWQGRQVVITLTRHWADSLPTVKDDTGQEYVDNRVTLLIRQLPDSSFFLRRTFTKASFNAWLDDDYRRNGVLENIVFHGVQDQKLKFGAVVSRPATDDEFIPFDLLFDRQKAMSVSLGQLYDDVEEHQLPPDDQPTVKKGQ